MRRKGKRKAFLKGGNSTCRFHLRQHYDIYKDKCEKGNIPVNHWAIPRPIWNDMEKAKEESERGRKTKNQLQQELGFKTLTGPHEFTRAITLHKVATLIATNNQVRRQQIYRCHRTHNSPVASRAC
jgi:hypothetical protein